MAHTSTKPKLHSLSSVGKIALSTQEPTNLSIVGVLMFLDGIFEAEDVVTLVKQRVIPKFPRFSSTVSKKYEFSHIPDYDCSSHINSLDVPKGMDTEENLHKLLSPLQNEPLDATKPLWDLFVVHLISEDTTVLYWRIHHCIGDGTSIAMLLGSISDQHWNKQIHEPKQGRRNIFQYIGALFKIWIFIIGILLVFLHWTKTFLLNLVPGRNPKQLKYKLSTAHEIAWDRRIIEVKKAKDIISHIEHSLSVKHHITLNDLMMSCMAQAIARYYKETFHASPKTLPIAIPVNLAPSRRSLGNKIGSLSVALPMDIDDPVDRVVKVSKFSNKAKRLPEPIVTFNLTKILAKLPQKMTNFVTNMLGSQVYCVMSNVRGSPFTLAFEGHEMSGLVGLVPPPNGIAIATGLASYDDWLVGTINCDKGIIADPSRILQYYKEELTMLEETYLKKTE